MNMIKSVHIVVLVITATAAIEINSVVRNHYNDNVKNNTTTIIFTRLEHNVHALYNSMRAIIDSVFEIRYGPHHLQDVRDSLIDQHWSLDTLKSVLMSQADENESSSTSTTINCPSPEVVLISFQNLLAETLDTAFSVVTTATTPHNDHRIPMSEILAAYDDITQQSTECIEEDDDEVRVEKMFETFPMDIKSQAMVNGVMFACENSPIPDLRNGTRYIGVPVFEFDMLMDEEDDEEDDVKTTIKTYYGIAFGNSLHRYHVIYYDEHMYIAFKILPENYLMVTFASVAGKMYSPDLRCRMDDDDGVSCTLIHEPVTFNSIYLIEMIYDPETYVQTAHLIDETAMKSRRIGSIIIPNRFYAYRSRTTVMIDNDDDNGQLQKSCCEMPSFDIMVMCPFGDSITSCYLASFGELDGGGCSRHYANLHTNSVNMSTTTTTMSNVSALYIHRGWV